MPAPRLTAAGNGQGVATVAVTIPAGTAIGELILIKFATNANTTISTPAGYTVVAGQDTTSSGSTSSLMVYKIATAGDPGSSVSVTYGASSRVTALVLVYAQGTFDPAAPVHVGAITQFSTATGAYTHPAVTTTRPDGTVLAWAIEQAAAAGGPSTWTRPTGFTQAATAASTAGGGNNNHQAVAWMDSGAAGAKGPYSSTWSLSGVGSAATIVIAPAPAGPPPPTAIGDWFVWSGGVLVAADSFVWSGGVLVAADAV